MSDIQEEPQASALNKQWYAVCAEDHDELDIDEATEYDDELGVLWDAQEVEISPELDEALEALRCQTYEVRDALEQIVKNDPTKKAIWNEYIALTERKYKGENGGLVKAQNEDDAVDVLKASHSSPEVLSFHVVPPHLAS